MDRRATLATLLGKSKKTSKSSASTLVSSGLEAYTGPWNFEIAAHLLRRTTFGIEKQQVQNAVDMGMETTVNMLLADIAPPAPPLNFNFENDPYVDIGETWVNKGYNTDDLVNVGQVQNYRRISLRAWTVEQLMFEGMHIREKMTLFWHNHFVTSDVPDPLLEWQYIKTLRENALGNFRELSKKITVDPAMLIYLNGNENSLQAPNENYARELFELFTIGKGPLVGPGDYSNYTEEDIREAARCLTGWVIDPRDFAQENVNLDEIAIYFSLIHDRGNKQFSNRFENTIISNADANEYKALVDMIFTQDECARFISRKLYRWFIYYDISPEAEMNVIEPMAQLLIANDYEIKPLLSVLFQSQHFYDMLNIGPMIKNPIDFTFSVLKATNYKTKIPTELAQRYNVLFILTYVFQFEAMQMVYFSPPDVAGWKAYYQEPSFYRIWINSATLNARNDFTKFLMYATDDQGRPSPFRLDVLGFTAQLDNPSDPNDLIDEAADILFPQPITEDQKKFLKGILIPGLPDFEWSVEYGEYLSDPDNSDLKNAVETKLRALYDTMLSMPEFYLS